MTVLQQIFLIHIIAVAAEKSRTDWHIDRGRKGRSLVTNRNPRKP